MVRLTFLALILSICLPARALADRWQSITTAPMIGVANTMAVAPGDPSVLYAGSLDSRLFRTTDGGLSWQAFKIQPERLRQGRQVTHLLVSPAEPFTIYAGFVDYWPTALVSRDGGEHWEALSAPEPVQAVWPGQPDTLFTAAYISTDGGTSWSYMKDLKGQHRAVYTNPAQPGEAIVGVYRTDDALQTWRQPPGLTSEPVAFAGDPSDPSLVYAATDLGLDISIDGGQSFSRHPSAARGVVRSVSVVPGSADSVYIVRDTSDGVRLEFSPDAGLSWQQIGTSIANLYPHLIPRQIIVLGQGRLVVRVRLASELAAGTRHPHGVLLLTNDQGETWHVAGEDVLVRPELSLAETALSQTGERTWFVGNASGLFRRQTSEQDWVRLPLPQPKWLSVADGGRVLYAQPTSPRHTYPDTALRSMDGGQTWDRISLPLPTTNALIVHPEGDVLYVHAGNHMYRSVDQGDSWDLRGLFNGYGSPHAFVSPHDPDILHARQQGDLWTVSEDGGRTWMPVVDEVDLLVIGWHPTEPGRLIAGLRRGVDLWPDVELDLFWSFDGGHNVLPIRTLAPYGTFWEVSLLPVPGGDWLFSAGVNGVSHSRDGGLTWSLPGDNPIETSAFALATEPHQVLAATSEGIWSLALPESVQAENPPMPVAVYDTSAALGEWEYPVDELEITSLTQDTAGAIWFSVATGQNPLVGRWVDGAVDYPFRPEESSGEFRAPLTADPDGGVWSGIHYWDGERWLDRTPANADQIGIYPYFTVHLVDRSDEIWHSIQGDCYGSSGGAYVIRDNLLQSAVDVFDISVGWRLVNDGYINVIRERPNSEIWFGTGGYRCHSSATIGGLTSFDGEIWRSITVAEGLAHPWVRDIAFVEDTVWVATDGGLTRFTGDAQQTSRSRGISYTTNNSALPHDEVTSLATDSLGAIWIGTAGGVSRFHGYWTHFTTANGLPGSHVNDVLIDRRDGRIWMATARGLAVVRHTSSQRIAVEPPSAPETPTNPSATPPDPTDPAVPLVFGLEQSYPNPARSEVIIPYTLAEGGAVRLTLYNVLGQSVRVLVDDYRVAGPHQVGCDGRDLHGNPLSSGIYFYRLESLGQQSSRRLVLLR
ncbi:MAG: T9SS type A sorting domain-containing protein [Gemmatimonadetes bacterium]|nr:T9SS type A sorting domain-containing protein [Gemmatimonadota bacterium]MBT7858737.1 T9SS type A sorting domain-containing protein [Gemmatimonadota bacterium]